MKKVYLLLLTILFAATTNAQLTGTKSIPGTYPTIAAAVIDLNAQGVGAGGVIFNVAGGYTETAPVGGINVTATGTAANTIIFQKSGAGANPLITSPVGTITLTTTSAVVDGIFSFSGSDYVTIDGIDLLDNNASGAAMMEYGYGFFKPSATNGCQNNTIRNCVITMNNANNVDGTTNIFGPGSKGIYFGNVTINAMTTDLVIATASGRSDGNTIVSNTIQNCFMGIYMRGYGDGASPYTYIDQNNSIGGNAAGLGNTVRNYASPSSVLSSFGIQTFNENNLLVQYNNLNNLAGGGSPAGGLIGGISSTGSFTLNNSTYTIKNNTITLAQGINTSQTSGINIGTAGGTGTVTVSDNILTGFTNASGATAGAVFATVVSNTAGATVNITNNTYSNNQISGIVNMISMQASATAATANITGNTFTNNTVSNNVAGTTILIANGAPITGALNINNNTINGLNFVSSMSNTAALIFNAAGAATLAYTATGNNIQNITYPAGFTSTLYLMYCATGTPASANLSSNSISNITMNNVGAASIYGIYNTSAMATYTASNNTFSNINTNATGTTALIYNTAAFSTSGTVNNNSFTNINRSGASGTHYCIYTGSPATGTYNANTIDGITFSAAGSTGTIYGIYDISSGVNMTYTNNIVRNLSTPGTGTLYGIREFGVAGTKVIRNNQVYNFTTSAGGAGGFSATGISWLTGGAINEISGNQVYSINSTGTTGGTGGTIIGILCSSASTNTNNIFKNKLYDISSTSTGATIWGIQTTSGNINNVYNNLIGDIRSPFLNAANQVAGINFSGGTTDNAYYNTIYLNATSAGATFGNSAIFASTTPTVTLIDNILFNNSTANGATGFASAYRRTSTTLTSYGATSNRNLFYAGTPSASKLIFYDGTNSDQTLAAFKARVTPRDANSITENPPFLSTTGSSANFLHINPAGGSLAAQAGSVIAGINDDFDGDVRNPSTPDIGADEFTVCTGAVGGTASVTGPSAFCGSGTPVITATGYSAGVGSTYQWMSSNTAANYPASGTPVAGQTNPASLNTGVVSVTTYYWLRATCPTGTGTAYSNMLTITVSLSAASVTPSAPSICAGQSVTLTENGGTGISWAWSPGGATTQSILVSPATTTTYTVTVTSPGGCIATANVTVNVNPVPAGVTASASTNNICLGASVNLFSTVTAISPAILSQNFEAGIGSWTVVNTSSGGTDPSLVAWTLRPNGYAYSTDVFTGNQGASFVMANSDAAGSGITAFTTITSPAFSTVGYTSLNLSYIHYYRHVTAAGAFVDVSTDGTNWTTLQSFAATTGTAAAFAPATLDLSAYVGNPSVYVRFRHSGGWYYYWAVDNVAITGTPVANTFSWTSTPAGFTSNLQNPTGVSPTVNTTYTVTVTGIGGCTSTANTTVAVNTPVVTGVVVQPTTCVATDGSITLTVTGGTGGVGPYSFAWTGPGVNPTSQSQVNLGVGSYTVTVTDVPSGCTNVLTYPLPGPGGCNICPTILTLATNPTPTACANSNVVLTASGLADMGVTYGITFKQSTVALADPYVGGTVIATVPNGGLTSGGTVASTTTTFATSGNYFIYAILSPSPVDPACRPSVTVNLTVNPTPTINTIPNQTLCQGQPTAPVNFTGTPAGVVYQWTNSNTQIGLAASGLGNIASFITTNPTLAPITGTITVTPVTGLSTPIVTNFNYTGAVQTFTVPAGITSINIKAWGAQGNSNPQNVVGGLGGYAEGNLAVVPGQTLFVYTGGGATSTINGGFNGGGAGGINSGCATAQGGGGGGASDVRTVNTLAGRILVAGGGGGAGANRVAGCGRGTGGGGGGGYYGGGGGAGWPGPPGTEGPVPTGGTQSAGGAGGITTFSPGPTNGLPGALGVGGAGGTEIGSNQGGSATAESGGIGGGLIGGSGLYNNVNNWCGQSGAGGSSYIGGVSAGITTPGLRTGNGLVTITYTPPSATTCFGTPRTFTITVNPNPSIIITAIPGTTLCQGDPALLTVVTGVGTPIGTLYTQTGTAGGSPNSQAFEPANAPFNNQAAEDFVVPAGATWTISQVSANGLYFNGAGPSTSFNVFFYNNAATNIPGTLIASYTNLPYTGGASPVIAVPNTVLAAGTYWVSIQSNMSFAAGGQWAWGAAGTTAIGNPWTWQNPNGGFGVCPTWGPGSTTCVPGTGANLLFTLTGTSVTGGGPLPPGYTFLWSPAAGLSSTTTNPVAASPATTTTYTVNVNTAQGCANTASILITVNLRPTITSQPASRTNCVGSTATFTVTGTGTNLAYQWQVSTTGCAGPWTNLANAAPYSGVNTATLTVNPVALAMNNNNYRCVLTGVCAPIGTANISGCAVLTVNPLPAVTVTPTVSCGSTTGNCTAITASGANTYVWTPATGLFLDCAATIPYVAGSNAATVYARPTAFTVYTVTGSLTATGCNSTATAIVNYTPPAPTVTPSSVTMCLGDAAVKLKSSSSQSFSSTFNSGTLALAIPDGPATWPQTVFPGVSTPNLAVSGIPAGATITGMSVKLNLTHTFIADMVIVLKAPNGQVLNLDANINKTGVAGANFVNTIISSASTTPLSNGTAPYTNTFQPDAVGASYVALGFPFPGGPTSPAGYIPTTSTWSNLYATPNGNWTMGIYDWGAGDLGTLTNWELKIDYVVGVPATPAVWSPAAGLFSDAAALTPYVAGTAVDSVWTKPTPANVYNYTATVQSLPVPPMVFSNPAPIIIQDATTGNPYPANLVVSGLPATGVAVKNVTLANMNHTWTADVDILLQSPGGQNVILLSDFGGSNDLSNTTLIFDDAAAATVTNVNPIPSGTYKPTNVGTPDNFPAPGPGSITQATPTLATFTGDMNGTWKLFIIDQAGGDAGNINGGYSIGFLLTAPPCTSPARTVVVTVNAPTTVATQPVNQVICTDKVATFTVAGGGSGPFSYQWQVSTDNGNNWNPIANGGVYAGVTTATLTVTAPPVTMNGYFYRCLVTGAAPCASATSFQAKLTVNPLPTIVITASPLTSLFPGLRTTLSSTVSPVAAQSYAWLRDGVQVGNTATLPVDVNGLGDYVLRVTDVNNCTNISNKITIKDSVSGKCFIYPNPNNGQFQVRYYSVNNNVALPRTLTVYDAKGTRVMTQSYSIGRPYDRMEVDLRSHGKGLYWVEIGDMNGNRLTMCRLVVE